MSFFKLVPRERLDSTYAAAENSSNSCSLCGIMVKSSGGGGGALGLIPVCTHSLACMHVNLHLKLFI